MELQRKTKNQPIFCVELLNSMLKNEKQQLCTVTDTYNCSRIAQFPRNLSANYSK